MIVRRHGARRMVVSLVVLAAFASTSCGGPNDDPITLGDDLSPVCTSATAFSRAAAYAGPPPHPIVIFVSPDGNGIDSVIKTSYSTYTAFGGEQLDQSVRDAYSVTSAFERVQLVGCVLRTGAAPAGTTCSFDIGGSAPLASATYELTVLEARTAKQVAGPIVIQPDNQDCPSSANVDADDPEVYTSPSDGQILRAVRQHVER